MKQTKLWMLALLVFVMAIMAFPTQAQAAKVKVTSVKVQDPYAKKIEVAKGKSVKVVPVVTVTPDSSKNKKVTFKSNNKKIATVNAKGVVKGKKAGKTKIVITSKKNKKKKATIQVVVKKKPIKKVTLSKTNVTLTVGTPIKLAATVTTQKGSSKNVYWTSDQPGVATVSQDGMITPLKPGKATVTVAATDGSKKKATCTVNVVAKPADNTVSLVAMEVGDNGAVKFSLNRPFKLSLEDIKIMMKTTAASKYVYEVPMETLMTTDNQNYVLRFDYYYTSFSYGHYVKLEIPKLTGATKSIEKQFLPKADSYTDRTVVVGKAGTTVSKTVYASYLRGYCNVKVSNLPAGLQYNAYNGEAYIYGTPKKSGVYQALMTAQDEYGNTLKKDIIFLIGDTNTIVAQYQDIETWTGLSYTSVEQQISVAGGSGSYQYSIASSNGQFSVNEKGVVKGKIYASGNYKVVVNVVDENNPAIATKATLNIKVQESAIVTGIVKTLGGGTCDSNVSVYFYQKDKYFDSSYYGEVQKGMFRVALAPGTWNVVVSSDDGGMELHEIKNLNITSQTETLDLQIPYVKIRVICPYTNEPVSWMDATGETIARGNVFYVKPGTYTMTSSPNSANLKAAMTDLRLNFTADKKDMTVRATGTSTKKTMPQITLGVHTVTLGQGEVCWKKFVPTETANYVFYSAAFQDTYGYLCDENGETIMSADSGASNGDFKISCKLEAGKTYYYGAKYWSSSAQGTFDVVLEKEQ